MHSLFATFSASSYWDSVLALGAPIVLAALATMLASRAGVLFVAVEGVMLVSCFAAVATTAKTGSVTWGIVAALLAGTATGAFSAWVSIGLRAGDVVSGLVISIGGLGLTSFLAERWFPGGAIITPSERLGAPWSTGPGTGLSFLIDQQPLVYLSILIAAGIVLFLRSRAGLRLRVCGEDMDVATGLGVPIRQVRYAAVSAAGAITGLAGASLGLAVVGSFDGDPVSGRGFIALACVILGGWSTPWVIVAALFFSAADIFGYQTTLSGAQQWGPLLPYLLTLVALGTLNRRGRQGPRDEGRAVDDVPNTSSSRRPRAQRTGA